MFFHSCVYIFTILFKRGRIHYPRGVDYILFDHQAAVTAAKFRYHPEQLEDTYILIINQYLTRLATSTQIEIFVFIFPIIIEGSAMSTDYTCCLCHVESSRCTRKCITCCSGEKRICDSCYGTRNKCFGCKPAADEPLVKTRHDFLFGYVWIA